jgi:hypothetical protein
MNKAQLDYLKVVLLGQLLIESIDNLKGTTKYRREVKMMGNNFVTALERYVSEDYNGVYANNEEMTMNVMRKTTELISKLSTTSLDELVMIDAVIDKYKENKEWFTQHASADFLKLN